MKYFILINQQVLSKTELDIIDGAILDYIYFYCNSPNEKVKSQRIIDKNEIWTWIDYQSLLEDMPMLKFKSGGILTLRINKIENTGYIKTKRFQHMKKYFQMTAKSDGLFIQMNRAIHTDEQGYSISRTDPIQSDEPIKIKDNKDKTIKVVSKADEEFNLLKEIIKMLKDKQKHIQIIGIWLKAKNPKIENKKQLQSFIKRNLRSAKLLEGYSATRIIEVMKWLKDNADFKITLETVSKYVDEDLKKLTPEKILTIE